MGIVHRRTDIDYEKIRRAFNTERTNIVLYTKLLSIKAKAIAIFVSRVEHTHPVTLPPYATSFKIEKARARFAPTFRLINTDPAAFWVEYGAYVHHETHPMILRYAPIRRAVDAEAAGDF